MKRKNLFGKTSLLETKSPCYNEQSLKCWKVLVGRVGSSW